jgi:hypothetical protein
MNIEDFTEYDVIQCKNEDEWNGICDLLTNLGIKVCSGRNFNHTDYYNHLNVKAIRPKTGSFPYRIWETDIVHPASEFLMKDSLFNTIL